MNRLERLEALAARHPDSWLDEEITATGQSLPDLLKVARAATAVDALSASGQVTFGTGVAERAFNALSDALESLIREEVRSDA